MTIDEMKKILRKLIKQNRPFDMVYLMNDYFELAPKQPSKELLAERLRCLFEELGETAEAAIKGDADGVVDGLCDGIIFAIGILYNLGVDVDQAMSTVMQANLNKVRGTKSTRPNSQGYDLVKPEGWKAPHHYNNLGRLPEIFGDKQCLMNF